MYVEAPQNRPQEQMFKAFLKEAKPIMLALLVISYIPVVYGNIY